MKIFAIIPAYNEAGTIGDVIRSLLALNYVPVVVDDGSHDDTVAVACKAGATVLQHTVNLGQGAALQTGFEYARTHGADVMVTFDADGQYIASDIKTMIDAMEKEPLDVVLGSRFLGDPQHMPWHRKLLLKGGVIFTNITTGLNLSDTHNGLRALRVTTTGAIRLQQNRMAHASEILEQIAALHLAFPGSVLHDALYRIFAGQGTKEP